MGRDSGTYATCLGSSLQKDSRSYYTAMSNPIMPSSGEKTLNGPDFLDTRAELADIEQARMNMVMEHRRNSSNHSKNIMQKQTP
jgi:hypothetical protein